MLNTTKIHAGSVIVAVTAAVALGLSACATYADGTFTLETVRKDVIRSYPSVRQLTTADLASLLAKPGSVLLLDVREPQEYAVSHLSGARRIEPLNSFSQSNFRPTEASVHNKTVVLYCSVGVRSSRMAQKLQDALKRCGALDVYNLDGGVFAWHNEERPLVNDCGPTPFVHPYYSNYGQLLKHQQLARFEPSRLAGGRGERSIPDSAN